MQESIAVNSESTPPPTRQSIPFVRLAITSVFMGLANLVPGVSGGTMVLALGLYDEFIGSVSQLTRLRVALRPIMVLGILFGGSVVTILAFSSVMQFLMEMFQPGMLALFIGMTLGGAPLLYREMKPLRADSVVSTVLGILVMAAVAFLLKPDVRDPSFVLYFLGGIVGSSAMILPGISGSYMLLVLGLYLPIIGGLSDMKDAVGEGDMGLFVSVAMSVAVPVGLGVVTGIVSLSNLLKFCLERYHKPTIGFLMGLLLGSVLGLYPFQTASHDKLVRYAVPSNTDGERMELRVRGYGWEAKAGDPAYDTLMGLENDRTVVRVLNVDAENPPTNEDIAAARDAKAIVVAYDISVPRPVRRAAGDKAAGEVELVIIPNSEFSWPRAALVLALIFAGFAITFSLCRFGGEEKKPAPAA